MARRRMIDPSIWESDQILRLDPRKFRLYVFLISQADDEGRMKYLPKKWAAALSPESDDYDTAECEKDANEILAVGLVYAYRVEGSVYLYHPNWTKYQRVDHPQRSHFPEPDVGQPIASFSEPFSESIPDPIAEPFSPSLDKVSVDQKRGEEGASAAGMSPPAPPDPLPPERQDYNGLTMTPDGFARLCSRWPKATVLSYCETVRDYCKSHGKRYRDHEATVRNWLKRDGVPEIIPERWRAAPPGKCPSCGSTEIVGTGNRRGHPKCGVFWSYDSEHDSWGLETHSAEAPRAPAAS